MEQRISLITLAVEDMARAAAFYDALGWRRVEAEQGIVVYDLIGQSLALYPRALLARDLGIVDSGRHGFCGITLAHNVREKAEVPRLVAAAEAAGGRVLKAAHDVFWGGHVGFVADPDGHVWELAWNPFSPLGTDGAFQWGGA